MFKNLSINKIEEFFYTFYKYAPRLPYKLKNSIAEIAPYLVFLCAIIYIVPAVLPYTGFLMPAQVTDYSLANVLLLRGMYIIFGIILFISFKPLSYKKIKGWYNLFYIGIFQIFFSLIFFDLTSLIFAIILFYILFQIKELYS